MLYIYEFILTPHLEEAKGVASVSFWLCVHFCFWILHYSLIFFNTLIPILALYWVVLSWIWIMSAKYFEHLEFLVSMLISHSMESNSSRDFLNYLSIALKSFASVCNYTGLWRCLKCNSSLILKLPRVASLKFFCDLSFFILFLKFFIYSFIFGCFGSSLLPVGFLQLWWVGATLHCSAWTSHCSGFSCCGAWALGTRPSVAVVHGLSSCGSRVLERRLSSCGAWA